MFGLLLNFDIRIAQASNKRTAVQQLNPAPTKSLSITGCIRVRRKRILWLHAKDPGVPQNPSAFFIVTMEGKKIKKRLRLKIQFS